MTTRSAIVHSPDTDAQEETIGDKGCDGRLYGTPSAVRKAREDGKDYKDDTAGDHTGLASVSVGQISKSSLAKDGATWLHRFKPKRRLGESEERLTKDERTEQLIIVASCPLLRVHRGEDVSNRPTACIDVSIGEECRAAGEDRAIVS